MSMKRKKFTPVPEDLKLQIIHEYLVGKLTQRELGDKYGFHYRRIAQWFKERNQYDVYLSVTKQNQHKYATQPMGKSKLKISGVNSISWRGRRLETKYGCISAIQIPMPEHPAANAQGYVYEHRLVMEQKLGRLLEKSEIVHHIDLDPTNNDESNLILLANDSEHGRLHMLMQKAMVQLIESEDLRNLTKQLVEIIKNDGWHKTKKREFKRRKDADAC